MRCFKLAAFAVAALCLVACSSGSSPDAGPAANRVALPADIGTANGVPLLADADGAMDSLFRAKGYVFGPDIVKAAHAGDAGASYILAQMYAYGIAGAKPDRHKAFKLYVSLADNGMAEAKAMAGYMLLYGLGVEADVSHGLEMVAAAANDGCGLAYLFMGNFYAQSEPTPQNVAVAKACYAEAEARGVVEATELLNNMSQR